MEVVWCHFHKLNKSSEQRLLHQLQILVSILDLLFFCFLLFFFNRLPKSKIDLRHHFSFYTNIITLLLETWQKCYLKYNLILDMLPKGTYNLDNDVTYKDIMGVKEVRLWLKEKREIKGFTHEDVAEHEWIPRSYYTLIESGNKTPSGRCSQSNCTCFGFSMDNFF